MFLHSMLTAVPLKWSMVLTSMCVIGLASAAASSAQDEGAIDLSAEQAAGRLKLLGGDWSVKNGELVQASLRGGGFAFFHHRVHADVAISFQFFVHPEGDGVRSAGATLRSADSESYYGVHFDTRNDQVTLYVSPWRNRPDWIVLARKKVKLDEGRWYTASVEGMGKKLRVSLDGTEIFTAEDDRYASGVAGVYTSEGHVTFRNVRIGGTPGKLAKEWRDVTPPRRWQIVASAKSAGGYAAFPDVCRAKNGDLLCVFYSGYGHVSTPNEKWPKGGRIMAVRSSDEGRTWSKPSIVADTIHDDRDSHIGVLKDGTLICNWFVAANPNEPLPGNRPIAIMLSRSADHGRTWSNPEELKIDAPNWYASSAPIRELADGSFILGLYTENPATNHAFGATIKSYDGGRTWKDLATIGEKSGFYLDAETDVVALKDGTLLAALRSSKTDLYLSTSSDGGKSWSDVRSAGFKGHCPHFLRHSSGMILLAHRIPATALHWSTDEGRTWGGPLQLDTVGGAYPSCVELSDGMVYCVYYEEGPGSSIRGLRLKVEKTQVVIDKPT